MFLKSLTLKGFKSFADSTVMALEPGVTVVVGPNGSGKSNVVDAIAWVLGAQAPRSVRSQKMDDVIFAGTEKRPALGRAEVSLTLDNSSGLLPVEFNEVTLTRILFRSGDSEYAINGVPCRLLDLQELLSDAGVGRQQHVIVSQGQIDAVLNARPEDRRAIIEEAAGVLKYRKRKEKAERRLDATEANLLRLQDLLREVRRQLRPLERQAEAARRHEVLVVELRALQTFVMGREIAGLRTRLETVAADRLDATAKESELKAELARLDAGILAAEAQLAARGEQDVTDRLRRVEQLRERARGLAAVLAERKRSLERDRGQLLDAGVVANLEADAARFQAELQEVAAALLQVAPDAEALGADEESFGAERERVLAALAEAEEGGGGSRAAAAAAEVRGELRTTRAALERTTAELRRATSRTDDVRNRLAKLAAEAGRLAAEVAAAESASTELADAAAAAERARLSAESAFEAATAAQQQAAEAASRWTARAEALQQALDAAHARAGAERLAGVEGVLGTLLDVVEIDAGWEPAVEAALGEALSAVVVDSPQSAQRALSELRSGNTTGAVLATRAGGRQFDPAHRTPAIGEPVLPHVRSGRPGVSGLVEALVGGAVRVPNLDAAIDAALAHPEVVIVTADGDRFAPNGWRIGAAGGGATAAALADARANADAAVATLAEADAELRAARDEQRATQQADVAATRAAEHNATTLASATSHRTRVAAQQAELAGELDGVDAALADLQAHAAAEQARIAELEGLLPGLAADEQAEADATRARAATRGELEARAAALAGRRRELEVRNAGLHERQAFLEARIAENQRRLEADRVERELAAERRVRIEQAIDTIDGWTARLATHRNTLEGEYLDLTELRRRQSDEVRALSTGLDADRRSRSTAEKALDEVRARHHKADLDEADQKVRLETTIEALRRDLDIEPEAAIAAECPELPEGATAAGRVRELDRELRLLGPINPLALEEFNELQQRHTFLEEQLEDVRSTRRDLSRVIKAVDQEIQSVFASAFADVAANFTQLFGTLFPGGQGKLVLTQPDDLLNTGIEVEAKPSGKNVKKLSLLSGGERSLTALAFLFAVFRSRPSPFYVMDEVEAALDDVNLHRFLGLIEEFRRDAQLIIVSHQKRTMEAGDLLLGVSMQPGGSSKVVTERASTAIARG